MTNVIGDVLIEALAASRTYGHRAVEETSLAATAPPDRVAHSLASDVIRRRPLRNRGTLREGDRHVRASSPGDDRRIPQLLVSIGPGAGFVRPAGPDRSLG